MIINKQVGGVYLIDPTIIDPTTRIVKVLSLDCVAISKINVAPLDSRIIFSDEEGKPTASVKFNSSLQYQDDGGTPTNWTGTIDQLLEKLNNEYFITSSGGGGSTSDTTAANQVLNIAKLEEIRTEQSTAAKQDVQTALLNTLEDNTKRKAIGSVVDLTADINGDWVGFPLAADTLSLTINGDTFDFSIPQVSANNEVLVEQFNNAQKLVSFDYVKNEDKIVFNGVSVSNVEVQLIVINVVGLAQLGYNTFTESTEQETGALQQLVLLLQAQLQVSKGADPKPTPERLLNPQNIQITGFKYLVFSCDGANNSITVTQNGSSVTYPQANLDGSLIRGYELPLSKVTYTNSITFNGTGTVDILKID